MEGFRFEEGRLSNPVQIHDSLQKSFADIHLETLETMHEALHLFWVQDSNQLKTNEPAPNDFPLTGPSVHDIGPNQPHSPGLPLTSDLSLSTSSLPLLSPKSQNLT